MDQTMEADCLTNPLGPHCMKQNLRRRKVPSNHNQFKPVTMRDVLASIPGFNIKCTRRRPHKKLSTAAQLEQTKEGCIDLETPDSILVNTNLRLLLNKGTFSSLPPLYRNKLVQLLPHVDRQDSDIAPTALNNEFFARACIEWQERLSEGEFTPENQQKLKLEADKERSRLDPWKLKHFEPIWGHSSIHVFGGHLSSRPSLKTTIKLRPSTSNVPARIDKPPQVIPTRRVPRTEGAITRSCSSTLRSDGVERAIPDLLPIRSRSALVKLNRQSLVQQPKFNIDPSGHENSNERQAKRRKPTSSTCEIITPPFSPKSVKRKTPTPCADSAASMESPLPQTEIAEVPVVLREFPEEPDTINACTSSNVMDEIEPHASPESILQPAVLHIESKSVETDTDQQPHINIKEDELSSCATNSSDTSQSNGTNIGSSSDDVSECEVVVQDEVPSNVHTLTDNVFAESSEDLHSTQNDEMLVDNDEYAQENDARSGEESLFDMVEEDDDNEMMSEEVDDEDDYDDDEEDDDENEEDEEDDDDYDRNEGIVNAADNSVSSSLEIVNHPLLVPRSQCRQESTINHLDIQEVITILPPTGIQSSTSIVMSSNIEDFNLTASSSLAASHSSTFGFLKTNNSQFDGMLTSGLYLTETGNGDEMQRDTQVDTEYEDEEEDDEEEEFEELEEEEDEEDEEELEHDGAVDDKDEGRLDVAHDNTSNMDSIKLTPEETEHSNTCGPSEGSDQELVVKSEKSSLSSDTSNQSDVSSMDADYMGNSKRESPYESHAIEMHGTENDKCVSTEDTSQDQLEINLQQVDMPSTYFADADTSGQSCWTMLDNCKTEMVSEPKPHELHTDFPSIAPSVEILKIENSEKSDDATALCNSTVDDAANVLSQRPPTPMDQGLPPAISSSSSSIVTSDDSSLMSVVKVFNSSGTSTERITSSSAHLTPHIEVIPIRPLTSNSSRIEVKLTTAATSPNTPLTYQSGTHMTDFQQRIMPASTEQWHFSTQSTTSKLHPSHLHQHPNGMLNIIATNPVQPHLHTHTSTAPNTGSVLVATTTPKIFHHSDGTGSQATGNFAVATNVNASDHVEMEVSLMQSAPLHVHQHQPPTGIHSSHQNLPIDNTIVAANGGATTLISPMSKPAPGQVVVATASSPPTILCLPKSTITPANTHHFPVSIAASTSTTISYLALGAQAPPHAPQATPIVQHVTAATQLPPVHVNHPPASNRCSYHSKSKSNRGSQANMSSGNNSGGVSHGSGSGGGRGRDSNNNKPPPGAVNLERGYQICQAVIQNSPNRDQLRCQLKPPPSLLAQQKNSMLAISSSSSNSVTTTTVTTAFTTCSSSAATSVSVHQKCTMDRKTYNKTFGGTMSANGGGAPKPANNNVIVNAFHVVPQNGLKTLSVAQTIPLATDSKGGAPFAYHQQRQQLVATAAPPPNHCTDGTSPPVVVRHVFTSTPQGIPLTMAVLPQSSTISPEIIDPHSQLAQPMGQYILVQRAPTIHDHHHHHHHHRHHIPRSSSAPPVTPQQPQHHQTQPQLPAQQQQPQSQRHHHHHHVPCRPHDHNPTTFHLTNNASAGGTVNATVIATSTNDSNAGLGAHLVPLGTAAATTRCRPSSADIGYHHHHHHHHHQGDSSTPLNPNATVMQLHHHPLESDVIVQCPSSGTQTVARRTQRLSRPANILYSTDVANLTGAIDGQHAGAQALHTLNSTYTIIGGAVTESVTSDPVRGAHACDSLERNHHPHHATQQHQSQQPQQQQSTATMQTQMIHINTTQMQAPLIAQKTTSTSPMNAVALSTSIPTAATVTNNSANLNINVTANPSPPCSCNVKTMIVCKKCGVFSPDDCTNSSKLCRTCFIRSNNNANFNLISFNFG